MDFLVGATAKISGPGDRSENSKKPLEARVLAIRPARGSRKKKQRSERRGQPGRVRDPVGGRVLLLLVPDGANLPVDLAEGEYRVFLRFKKR